MTTPYSHRPGPDGPMVPPPGCPAHGMTAGELNSHGPSGGQDTIGPTLHGLAAGGLRRLYGPEAENDPMGLYEKLRAEHGSVAPVLLHGDVPAWLVLGHSDNLHMTRTPSQFSRDSRRWRALHDGTAPPTIPSRPSSPGSPSVSSPTAPSMSGCAARSPTRSHGSTTAASGAISTATATGWSTSSAGTAGRIWSAGSPSICR